MRILVTGAAGLIGSHLVDHLLSMGSKVIGVDNLLTGSPSNLAAARSHPGFSFLQGDICDSETIARVGSVDQVFHLACPPSPADFNSMPVEILRVSSIGTLHVAEFACAHGARLVLASTSEVYGEPEEHPQPECYRGNVSTTGPRACYDEGKRFSEAVVSSFARSEGLDAGIARIFNTYGPRMRVDDGRVVANFVVQAIRGAPLTVQGTGHQTRSFCYVDDQVRGLVALMGSGCLGPFNIGSEEEHLIIDLARIVVEMTESTSTIEHWSLPRDDPSRRRPDISAAREHLGWEPSTPLRVGLEKVIEYFRATPPK
jgi:dTDP-glucose 4,6-dehydratase